jgi:very-short-patch-repair endonuclease
LPGGKKDSVGDVVALPEIMIGEPEALSRARELRREMTPAERLLWKLLRNRRLRGWKFRRQTAISIYIADFYCHELKLIIELDGDVHSTRSQIAHDDNRDFYLKDLGIVVLRFPNRQVFDQPDKVLDRIAQVATERSALLSKQP